MSAQNEMANGIGRSLSTDKPKRGRLAKAAPKAAEVEASTDPREELRRLVMEHKALTQKAASIERMSSDVTRQTGEVIACRLPADTRVELNMAVEHMRKRAGALETAMLRQLKQVPIYKVFLANVFGMGPVVCAYLVAMIDIHKAVKISNLRRFCGLAVIDGRLERPRAGQKLAYCAELRTRLYQGFASMWKCSGIKAAERPHGTTSKYLEIWRGYKHRMEHSERYDAAKNTLKAWSERGVTSECDEQKSERARASGCARTVASDVHISDVEPEERERASESGCETRRASGRARAEADRGERAIGIDESDKAERAPGLRKGARGVIHATGWHKAADVFLEDLYTVWRALEGLPVWGSYYAEKLGYLHAGAPAMRGPRMLTVEEALAMVGHVGAVAMPEGRP